MHRSMGRVEGLALTLMVFVSVLNPKEGKAQAVDNDGIEKIEVLDPTQEAQGDVPDSGAGLVKTTPGDGTPDGVQTITGGNTPVESTGSNELVAAIKEDFDGPHENGATPVAASSATAESGKFYVNAGGPAVGAWQGTTGFTGGNIGVTKEKISGADGDLSTVGQTELFGPELAFDLRVPKGAYTVKVHYVEAFFNAPYRRFRVSTKGKVLEESLDIFTAAGGKNKLLTKEYQVQAENGSIHLDFVATSNNASVSGIEVIPADGSQPAPGAAPAAAPVATETTKPEVKPEAKPTVPAPSPTPTPAPSPVGSGDFISTIRSDFSGENGPGGYPCGVPNGYGWKFAGPGLEDVGKGIIGRGTQLAGAGYNQVYNACTAGSPRKSMPNARIEFTDLVVDYLSISQGKWVRAVKQPVGGAAFAEDFVNDQATGADIRDEPNGRKSVRSGIGNAGGGAGGSTGRSVEDSQVGFNFHGFPNRFDINWGDAKAVIVSQKMKCIPQSGTDMSDCKKLGYIANVGLDSWASTGSQFDGFKTHGGVSGGRFKFVTGEDQYFTNYIGPLELLNTNPPPPPGL
jgi:Malectin domain